jgi:hypothetical protein
MLTGRNSNGLGCVRRKRNGVTIGSAATGGTISEMHEAGDGD